MSVREQCGVARLQGATRAPRRQHVCGQHDAVGAGGRQQRRQQDAQAHLGQGQPADGREDQDPEGALPVPEGERERERERERDKVANKETAWKKTTLLPAFASVPAIFPPPPPPPPLPLFFISVSVMVPSLLSGEMCKPLRAADKNAAESSKRNFKLPFNSEVWGLIRLKK